MITQNNTICAISTPPGQGAIALIRLCGAETLTIIKQVFKPVGKAELNNIKPNYQYFGKINDHEGEIDEVLLCFYKSPKSYTGDDMAEISCHGSVYIQQRIVQQLLKQGAQMAQPGEFTMRAFMNGKMDLSQAEAVGDIIASGSKAAHKLAMSQLRGEFSDALKDLRTELLNISSLLELELDFSEEDVEFADRTQLLQLTNHLIQSIEKLTQSFSYGNAVKKGVPATIVGKTNVGKSTLLNKLLRDDKAIVSNIHGTTRDAVEDTFTIQGIQFRFIDTAGLRKSTDEIENEGIKRTHKLAKKAQVILFVIDAAETEFDVNQVDEFLNINSLQIDNILIVINKTDISQNVPQIKRAICESWPSAQMCFISAKNNEGITALEELLVAKVNKLLPEDQDVVVTNLRHYEALSQALEATQRAKAGIETNIPSDLAANDIREVIHYLGEITGDISTDDILGNIFKNFCIGK